MAPRALFADRAEAGRRLGEALRSHSGPDVVVVGLPRGGVPVAYAIAQALDAPLDVIVVRKLGLPSQPELGVGAIGEGDVRIVNDDVVRKTGMTEDELVIVEQTERAELLRRVQRFRGGRPPLSLDGRTVIVVDDGIATGSTARAACRVARAQGASAVLLASPVGPERVQKTMRPAADDVVCLSMPAEFSAISQFYDDFTQTSDAEVVELLRLAAAHSATAGWPQ
ncbi:MAG: phosphoribosyltransferase [Frankiales bacterium]|nr:phosphoribosyltransferase [Frankiales bacterium]